jgi:hypothetical protein
LRWGSWQLTQSNFDEAGALAKQGLRANVAAWNRTADGWLDSGNGASVGGRWQSPQSPTTWPAEASLGRAIAGSGNPSSMATR